MTLTHSHGAARRAGGWQMHDAALPLTIAAMRALMARRLLDAQRSP